jgi:membrane protein required for colicin V production
MIIDILFGIVLALALLKGYKEGLIVGIFSLLAIIIGLAAALKLSAVVAARIGNSVKVSAEWLPFISFIIVFVVVVLLVRLGAKAIEKAVQMVLLGWVNRLGGMIFYIAIYTIVFSVVLFFAEHMMLVKPATIQSSVTYPFVQPWGPKVINGLGSIIPFFKDLFKELEEFFGRLQARF